jgi:broad specificity phosphatase PhoE
MRDIGVDVPSTACHLVRVNALPLVRPAPRLERGERARDHRLPPERRLRPEREGPPARELPTRAARRARAHARGDARALLRLPRARETAELLCELNGLAPPVIEPRLRERSFGELELGPSTGYETIWARDREFADHHERGCESTAEVTPASRRSSRTSSARVRRRF